MKRHLTRFLPLSRSTVEMSATDSKPCSAFARVQDHVEELRRYFELPDEELFIDEFYCALHKRILLQGRMYIFEHHLCFYSNVFGWVKRKIIPLSEVKCVVKKRNYGFPNSIEVHWKKREFFTSFLNRNDAFDLLQEAVQQARPSSPCDTPGAQSEDTPSSSSSIGSRRSGGSSGIRIAKRPSKDSGDGADEDSDLEPNDDDLDILSVISGPAPAIPENMALLCEDEYDVTVQEFFNRTLSMDSMFLDNYHKARGDSRFRMSEWEQLNEISGFVRQAAFVSPVKGVRGMGFMSPKNTECNQDHRLCVYHGDHVVFQISQVMKDIPYGDNFSVEMRWDVHPLTDGTACRISIYVAVPFIRSVLAPFKSLIESNVMKEMQDSVKIMAEMLKDTLSPVPEAPLAESGVDPSDDGETVETSSSRIIAKLEQLLSHEEGLQKLEQLLGSTELQGKASLSTELPQVLSQPAQQTTMNFESPLPIPANWLLFLCCMFMLFCQAVLVVLWLMGPRSSPAVSALDHLDGSMDHPIKQLYDLERSFLSVIQALNNTLSEYRPPQ